MTRNKKQCQAFNSLPPWTIYVPVNTCRTPPIKIKQEDNN